MRTLKKLKLNSLSKTALEKKELSYLLGGDGCCSCGCGYEHITTSQNFSANSSDGYTESYDWTGKCGCVGAGDETDASDSRSSHTSC